MKTNTQTLMPVVRRPKFGLEKGFPKYYWGGHKIATHLINAMHVVFPEGERMFVRATKAYADAIKDPVLQNRIKAFIAQETQHGSQHERLWKVLEAQGVHCTDYQEWHKEDAYGKHEGFLSGLLSEEFGKRMRLSVTAALEHYTSTLGLIALDEHIGLLKDCDPVMADLLKWHAIEEVEHRDVAFDVMMQVDGSQFTKNLGLLVGTWALIRYQGLGWLKFVWEDKDIPKGDIPRLLLQDLPVLVKMVTALGPKILDYLRGDFHPTDHGGEEQIARYLAGREKYFPEVKTV